MKIFAVYTTVTLSVQPEWLSEFRKKYDDPWKLHSTLKQPCWIQDARIGKLHKQVESFVATLDGPVPVRFDEILIHPGKHGATVMVRAKKADQLIQLQKALLKALPNYKEYVDPESRAWEEQYDPHITIGRRLSDQQSQPASTYLEAGCALEGAANKIVLSIVQNDTIEEGTDPANQTIYSL